MPCTDSTASTSKALKTRGGQRSAPRRDPPPRLLPHSLQRLSRLSCPSPAFPSVPRSFPRRHCPPLRRLPLSRRSCLQPSSVGTQTLHGPCSAAWLRPVSVASASLALSPSLRPSSPGGGGRSHEALTILHHPLRSRGRASICVQRRRHSNPATHAPAPSIHTHAAAPAADRQRLAH